MAASAVKDVSSGFTVANPVRTEGTKLQLGARIAALSRAQRLSVMITPMVRRNHALRYPDSAKEPDANCVATGSAIDLPACPTCGIGTLGSFAHICRIWKAAS